MIPLVSTKKAHNVRVDPARRLHSTFDSIDQVAIGAARASVQRFVGCGLCNSRPSAHSIPEKDNTGAKHDAGGIGN